MKYILEHTGKYIQMRNTDGYEWCSRMNDADIVSILPITLDEKVVLIEQFRIPVDKRVIECPAGMVDKGESLLQSAKRELMEETGYTSNNWFSLYKNSPVSSGLTNETINSFLALECEKEGIGGGLKSEGEDITIHLVKLKDVHNFIWDKEKNGLLIDPKICASLYWYSVYKEKE